MDAAPESGAPEPYTQQEQLVARLQPESEPEERLVRQIALCSVKLEHIETLLSKAEEQLQKVLEDSKDELTL
jgi:predicted type IV restriction endonuclease